MRWLPFACVESFAQTSPVRQARLTGSREEPKALSGSARGKQPVIEKRNSRLKRHRHELAASPFMRGNRIDEAETGTGAYKRADGGRKLDFIPDFQRNASRCESVFIR